MKRKFSSPPLVADGRQRKKSRRSDGTELLDLLTGKKPVVPHLLVTEVSYTPPSHKPSKLAFNRRGVVVAVPLDGAAETTVGKARHPSAAIRRRGRLADLYRRCVSFLGATPDGRLAFAGSKGVFLVNPVTDALQRVDTVGCCQKAVIAAAGGGGHGCSLFVSLGALFAPPTLWRLDDDGEGWSNFAVAATAEQTGDVVSAVDCNSCFYLLHEDGTVSKVYARGDDPAAAPLRMEKLPVASLADNFSPSCYNKTLAGGEGHLLESDGEVLFVRKLLAAKEIPAPFCAHAEFVGVVGFEVYRLDVAARRWAKIDRLPGGCGGGGGTAIFVSPESAFAVRTTTTSTAAVDAEHATTMMSNCVYFTGETRCCYACHVYGGSTWGAYSMERREVLFEHAVESRGGRTEAVWFLPSV